MKAKQVLCEECGHTNYLYKVYFDDGNELLLCEACMDENGFDILIDEAEEDTFDV